MANWTRHEVLAAMHLYTQLPFGKLHRGNPQIIELAECMGRTASSVAMKLVNLASLDPLIVASGRKGLSGASELDRAVWAELQHNWDEIALQAYAAYRSHVPGDAVSAIDVAQACATEAALIDTEPTAAGKTRSVTVQVRANQNLFRRAVLSSYEDRCCISGLAEPALLVASHIVPWSVDTHNRLNPRNGLCLSALHDKAFDLGLITVTPGDNRVRVSTRLRQRPMDDFLARALLSFDGQPIRLPQRYRPADEFLRWHGQRFEYG